ncbi:hypothetical protein ABZ543_07175 [Streptomyces roseifaciens]
MTLLSLADLGAPLIALRLLRTDFADLPAPCLSVSTIYPDLLELSFHDGLAAFEVWREALGLAPEAVSYREHSAGTARVLQAECDYAGARLQLTGYAKTPAPDALCSWEGAGP